MKWLFKHPWHLVLLILSLAMLGFGLYFVSPWYPAINAAAGATPSAFAQVFSATNERLFLGAFYVGVPAFTLLSIFRKKDSWVKTGALLLLMIYLFASLLRLITIGATPVYWLFILACGMIAGVARLALD